MWSANTKVRLPYPFLTTFHLVPSHDAQDKEAFQLSQNEGFAGEASLPVELHHDNISFTRPRVFTSTGLPTITALHQQGSRQDLVSICAWDGTKIATVNHIWLILYTIFTIEPDLETFRLQLDGPGSDTIAKELRLSMVALDSGGFSVVFRSSFWQGCASPLGSHSIWTSSANNAMPHLHYVIKSTTTIRRSHPLRLPKPAPNSFVYSRYIPKLDKVFSLVVIDHQDPTHVEFFHQSKRTSSPINDLGMQGDSLEEDYEYLHRQYEDAHTISLLGQFDGTLFGYFEVFWVKEDPLGVASDAGDFDRGFHASIGYSSFKSRRWLQACWSSLLHYVFLDEHRTENVIDDGVWGIELLGDAAFEFLEGEMVQLPHQRVHLTKYSREYFFSLCPFDGVAEDSNLQRPSRL